MFIFVFKFNSNVRIRNINYFCVENVQKADIAKKTTLSI